MKVRGAAALVVAVVLLAFGVFVSRPAQGAILSPTLDSVTPSQIVPGLTNQTVTLHGDFTSGQSTVAFAPDTGITQVGSPVTSEDMTTITVHVNVAADAPNTARDVTVTGGLLGSSSTCTKCITVGPDITSVSGPISNSSEAAPFTITGHAFKAPVSVTFSRSGYGFGATETDSVLAPSPSVTVGNNGTTISGTVNLFGRAPGRWKVAISQDNGGKATFGDGITTGMQVAGSKPTLATITPTRINTSETDKQFALVGANFAQGMTATVSGAGVTQSKKIVLGTSNSKLDPTHATLFLSSTSTPENGAQTIVLRNADGQASTNTDAICVNCDLPTPGVPTISTVSPTIVGLGASQLQMIVTGTNYTGALPTVTVSPNTTDANAITVGVTRDSATQLTLSLTVPMGAATGDHDLTVTTSGGSATKTAAFNVHSDFQVVSVNPPGRPQGFDGLAAINGAGFTGTPTVSITPGTDLIVGTVAIESAAKLKFQIKVGANADTTAHRDVSVTQGGTTKTCTGCFTVGKNPTVVSITPNAASGGAPASITAITGTDFVAGAVPTLEQAGQQSIAMTETNVESSTKISGTFDLTNAGPGKWSVRVTNVDGGNDILDDAFTVTQAAPTVGDVSPETFAQKATTTLTLTGTAFAPGMKVTFPDDDGITVGDVTRKSNTSADVKVTASDTAKLGARDITVTNTDGQSGTCQSCVVVVQGPQSRYFGDGVTAYENFNGGAFVAAGNIDGVPSNGVEFVTAPNAGGGPHIRPYRVNPANGAVQELGGGFMAYTPAFTGGVHVAVGNIDGVGGDEIITGAGPGGGPHVRIFHLNNDLSVSEPFGTGFFAYAPAFAGGVYVATADVNGDGKDEIITGAGPGGGPHVRVWKLNADGKTFSEFAGWMAYSQAFGGGVAVAGGNFVAEDSDKPVLEEVATVPSLGGGPHVRVFDGIGGVKREFMAFDPNSQDPLGYRITGGDWDFDTVADLAVSQVSSTSVVMVQLLDPPDNSRVMATQQPLGPSLPIGTNLAGADVDGDGDDDLIVSPDHASAVTIDLVRPLS
jgi:hypothetical protein